MDTYKKQLIIAAVILAILSASAIWFWNSGKSFSLANNQDDLTALTGATLGENYQIYKNDHYGFSLEHPKNLKIEEFDEGEGAATFVFVDETSREGFQIFASQVETDIDGAPSAEDIKADIPEMIIEEATEVVIGDSQHALIFWSEDPTIGRTREVWFINNGNLYAITAYEEFDPELAQIMDTLKFVK
ncbi:hypothetical protein A3B18_03860 [Candidatus Giovannonibacteria bacterium RIFCSPLOWO2_01_FULL_46_13]|uniref:DUF4367 domain-containing protein n=1 Tax=Candidatus Giovannonibacteria bacterium RIFCSPLOWO2_01_FULL_46_13 TaxID=1798352 RepID=A0A1F5X2X6_9BACT|nr:MAG: hypothetical protein A3B18_03860 [Candidatus Giovannonibacteria bacterium RIFCSPLOWO2_01_FULL_46_13]